MARENNQNKSLVGKSQNLLNLDAKRAAGKETAPENQSLKVQSKPIFDPFSSEPSSPTTLLATPDDSAYRTVGCEMVRVNPAGFGPVRVWVRSGSAFSLALTRMVRIH
jgi:hypothetical protein